MFIISPNFDILPLNYEQNDKGYKKKRQKPSKKNLMSHGKYIILLLNF